ncbi:MAG TPA: hypothetical protein VJS92_14450 [Candidatus Polarisedimenticolaceae bacterium]|nr:hypothetical protein [Candidatus Polarisedimenticolaceae bacterium]
MKLAWLLVAALVAGAPAEAGYVVLLGMTEGPDPLPTVAWQPVAGGASTDGRPDIALDPRTGYPLVVWATLRGNVYDIAFSEWSGSAWRATQFVAASARNELDPRVFVEGTGKVWVTWWEEAAQRVLVAWRTPGFAAWSAPLTVTSGPQRGRRPSVAVFQSELWLAYERSAGSGQEIVTARRQGSGPFRTAVAKTIARAAPLDVELHTEAGWLWIDWRHTDATFGWAVWNGEAWGPTQTLSWNDFSWQGVQQAQSAIRELVLH